MQGFHLRGKFRFYRRLVSRDRLVERGDLRVVIALRRGYARVYAFDGLVESCRERGNTIRVSLDVFFERGYRRVVVGGEVFYASLERGFFCGEALFERLFVVRRFLFYLRDLRLVRCREFSHNAVGVVYALLERGYLRLVVFL